MRAVKNSILSSLARAAILAAALGLPLCAQACAKSAAPAAGDAQAGGRIIAVEAVHDFGTVTEGDTVKHSFVIKNEGSNPLKIDRVQTSCGCTVAELKTKEIAPGATGQVEIAFNTQGRTGDQSKIITVLSNDPATPRLNLTIKAKVESLLAFDQPRYAASKTMHVGDKETIEAWITGKLVDSAKLAIDQVTGGEDAAAELITKTEGDKQRQGVRVTLKGSKIGNYHGSVALNTGVEKVPRLMLPFSWNVLGNVEIIPRAIYYATGPQAGPNVRDERVLQIKSRLPDFKIKGISVKEGPFTAVLQKPDGGVGFEVRVNVTDRSKLEKIATSAIELTTNDPIEPKINVPITISSGRPRMGPPAGMPSGRLMGPGMPGMPGHGGRPVPIVPPAASN